MGDEQDGKPAGGGATHALLGGLGHAAQRAVGLALILSAGALLLVAWVDLRPAPPSSVIVALPSPAAEPDLPRKTGPALASAMPEPVPTEPAMAPDPAAGGSEATEAATPEPMAPELAPAAPEAAPPATLAPEPQRSALIVPPEPVPAAKDPEEQKPETKKTGLPPWQRFAVSAPVPDGRPRVAIIIDDLGLDRPRTARAINLPGPVTLSFLAYAGDLTRQTEAARRAGHELLVHVPMEPISRRQDMGPNGLATDLPQEEVLRRLRWDLDRFDGYVGINNHMGSRFTGDERSMEPVIGELKARGLLFVDSRTVANSAGGSLSRSLGVPYASRDVFLDDEQTAGMIGARLHDVEAVARRRGTAIAIGHPHDATLAALTAWFATLPQQGFVLVPISAVVRVQGTGN